MVGDCTICMVTFGNWCKTGLQRITIDNGQTLIVIRKALRLDKSRSCAAVRGAMEPGMSALPAAAGTGRAVGAVASDFSVPSSFSVVLVSGFWNSRFWGPGAEAPGRIFTPQQSENACNAR